MEVVYQFRKASLRSRSLYSWRAGSLQWYRHHLHRNPQAIHAAAPALPRHSGCAVHLPAHVACPWTWVVLLVLYCPLPTSFITKPGLGKASQLLLYKVYKWVLRHVCMCTRTPKFLMNFTPIYSFLAL